MPVTWLQSALCRGPIPLIILFLTCLPAHADPAGQGIAPDRTISMLQSEPGAPAWKMLWDRARGMVGQQQFGQAAKAYAELLSIRPNIEEANWEYCKVLLKLGDYSTAAKVIGGLLDSDQNNINYLLAAGELASHRQNYQGAIRYYGKVLEREGFGSQADEALLGLANSLRKVGRKDLAFPLFEQFSIRHPENSAVRQQLALDAYELGKRDKAKQLLVKLTEEGAVDERLLLYAIELLEKPEDRAMKSRLQLEYLQLHPDHHSFRQQLAAYYIERAEFEAALEQLVYLADHAKNSEKFLLAAATISQQNLKRPDRALNFLERYRQIHPEDREIRRKIAAIEANLAREFLPIVENGEGESLWIDLAEITSNRRAIYSQMAELLEKKGQLRETIEVLETIRKHSAPDDDLALRIATLYYRLGQYQSALHFLGEVEKEESKTTSFYRLKAKLEQHLGLELASLRSCRQALAGDPGDLPLRNHCLELAGRIGDVQGAEALFQEYVQKTSGEVDAEMVFRYLDLLAYNFLFGNYGKIEAWARSRFADRPELLAKLALNKASALRREGKTREAEQLLRQLLNRGLFLDEVLFRLTDQAIADNQPAAAEHWYRALAEEVGQGSEGFSIAGQGCRLLLLRIRILKSEGNYGTALELLQGYLQGTSGHGASEAPDCLDRLRIEKCWLQYLAGEPMRAFAACSMLVDNGPFDPELWLLDGMLRRTLQQAGGQKREGLEVPGDRPVLSRLWPLAEKELEQRENLAAVRHVQLGLDEYPDSVVGQVLEAELMLAEGKGDAAAAAFDRLLKLFPHETYFKRKRIEVEIRRGRYHDGLALFTSEMKAQGDLEELAGALKARGDTEEVLFLARLLWGDKQAEESLQIYKKLLTPSVLEALNQRLGSQHLDTASRSRESGFWKSILLLLQSEPEELAELMSPLFLLDNRGQDVGMVVADFYAAYSWEQLITSEYLARKASFERNYYFAEQSYRRLLKQDSGEGMADLAKIYEKIGRYRKEAQMYEAMQKRGASTPELDQSMERNSLQIRPQNILDASYEERQGRDGFIDMAKRSVGTSFWITPDLDKDLRLQYTNNRFTALDSDQKAGSNILYSLATYDISKSYELVFGVGAEKLTGDGDTNFLYEMEVKGQLDDYVNAYLLLEKKPVYDTVAAIEQQVAFEAIKTGLRIETPMGLSLGGDLQHRFYTDGNEQNRLHGYSAYSIFGDALQLSVQYDYLYLVNNDANRSSAVLVDGSFATEPFYWSPDSFLEHRLGLNFQHNFLGYQQGSQKKMSYYALGSAIGLEDNQTLSFSTSFDIFLEMSPHFLLKGNFTLAKSDEYEEQGLFLSLYYRW